MTDIVQQLHQAFEPFRLWARSDTFFRDIVLIGLGLVLGFIVNELTQLKGVR